MVIFISYQFPTHTHAEKFINELAHWHKHEVKAKLFKQRTQVKVSYELEGKGFDYTASDLDDLATQYEGVES